MSTATAPIQTEIDGTDATAFLISVHNDFSDDPFGRFPTDGDLEYGDFSGERFREDFLRPALENHNKVHVDLNGNEYGSSFLEESFGGLVRKGYFTEADLKRKLTMSHKLQSYVASAWHYIERAEFEIG